MGRKSKKTRRSTCIKCGCALPPAAKTGRPAAKCVDCQDRSSRKRTLDRLHRDGHSAPPSSSEIEAWSSRLLALAATQVVTSPDEVAKLVGVPLPEGEELAQLVAAVAEHDDIRENPRGFIVRLLDLLIGASLMHLVARLGSMAPHAQATILRAAVKARSELGELTAQYAQVVLEIRPEIIRGRSALDGQIQPFNPPPKEPIC